MKKVKKYIDLFAIFLVGASPSLKAVEKTNAQKYTDDFNNPELQKIYEESDVLTQLFLNPKTKDDHYLLLFLGFALKCSLLPKDSPLKEEECEKLLKKGIETYGFETEDIELYQYFLKRLQNLDAKNVVDVIVPNSEGIGAPRNIAYEELVKNLIPLALHRGKKEEARYFYEKVTQHMTPERNILNIRNRLNEINVLYTRFILFNGRNRLHARLILLATEYANADTIIQDLLGAPYNITQDDMDSALLLVSNMLLLGFNMHFPSPYLDFNDLKG